MKRLIRFLVKRYLPNGGKYLETRIQASSKFYAILLNKIESRLEEINNRVEYINRVMNLLEKPTNLNQLKYLLKVIQIELDQL